MQFFSQCVNSFPIVPLSKSKSTPSAGPLLASGQSARPAYGSQVVIQSEHEKQLKKFFRKEEKRMAKQVKEIPTTEDHITQLRRRGYDPVEMRKERCVCVGGTYSPLPHQVGYHTLCVCIIIM